MSSIVSDEAGLPGQASRRTALGLATAALLLPAKALRAATPPEDTGFIISRKGSDVGRQETRFTASGAGLKVSLRTEIAVKVAFITAYRYTYAAEEEWRDGMPVASRIAVNDNGDQSLVEVREAGGQLQVTGPAGAYTAPLGMMTDGGFWNAKILEMRRLIDGQKGDIANVAFTRKGTSPVPGGRLQAVCYDIDAPGRPEGLVWYDAQGRLVGSEVHTKGEVLTFRLA